MTSHNKQRHTDQERKKNRQPLSLWVSSGEWSMSQRKARHCVRMKICFFTHLFWLLRVFAICGECRECTVCTLYTPPHSIYSFTQTPLPLNATAAAAALYVCGWIFFPSYPLLSLVSLSLTSMCSFRLSYTWPRQRRRAAYLFWVWADDFCGAHFVSSGT